MQTSVIDRIMNKVNFIDNCWIWTGSTKHKGAFPSISIKKKSCRVRELNLNLIDGVDVPTNMIVKSYCKNDLCVNPEHLYICSRSGIPNFKNRVERKKKEIDVRFWEHVNKGSIEECWEWKKSLDGKGYGQFNINKKMKRSHRLAYKFSFGEFDSNLEVCHRCDNPKCCNPNHLFLGTHADNMRDMKEKGRSKK